MSSVTSDIDLMDLEPFVMGTDLESFRVLRDTDPLHWNSEPDGPGFWSVTRYADVKQVAGDHDSFSSEDGTQIQSRRAEGEGLHSMHNSDPPRHTKLRKPVSKHLRPVNVAKWEGRIRQVVDELLDEGLERGSFDLVEVISARLPLLIFGTMLGAPAQDCPHLLRWTNEIASEDPDYSSGPEAAVRARVEIFDYFHDLERLRKSDPRDDLISFLVQSEIDGRPFGREELDPYYLLLTVAGNETTRNLISGGVLALADHADEWRLLRQDPARLGTAVEEMVRYTSPVICMRRTATADTAMHGRTIRAGDKVVLWFASANRDERVFEKPDLFRGDRTPNIHFGFGWGVHACMGSHLARLETEILFRRIIERGIVVTVDERPQRLRSNWFRGIKHLPVTMTA